MHGKCWMDCVEDLHKVRISRYYTVSQLADDQFYYRRLQKKSSQWQELVAASMLKPASW